MTTAKVIVGDAWRDGHGMSDSFFIHIPDGVDVDKAYLRAVEEVGDLTDFCQRFDDHNIPIEFIDRVFRLCTELRIFVDFSEDSELRDYAETMNRETLDLNRNDEYWIFPSEFFELWIAMVNIGICLLRDRKLGELVYEIKTVEEKEFHIGGYGLFRA